MPGCGAPGEYRAPKSRSNLTEYWWFCLEHVRAYNASWDFYKGMTPGEIEAQLRADTGWQRPTWPLGRLGAGINVELLHDPLDLLGGRGNGGRGSVRDRAGPPDELVEALALLGLAWPTTLEAVKTRYKALAKQLHPDINGRDRLAEDRLKTINLAYATLRSRLAEARLAATG